MAADRSSMDELIFGFAPESVVPEETNGCMGTIDEAIVREKYRRLTAASSFSRSHTGPIRSVFAPPAHHRAIFRLTGYSFLLPIKPKIPFPTAIHVIPFLFHHRENSVLVTSPYHRNRCYSISIQYFVELSDILQLILP